MKILLFLMLLCPAAVFAENLQKLALTVDGKERVAYLHFPKNIQSDPGLLPTVFLLHGGGGSAESAERMSRMSWVADKNRFLVVYPEGMRASLLGGNAWNAGNCCANPKKYKVNDVKFIAVLIEELRVRFRLDPKRVFVSGFSNGAQMSYRLACELGDKIAAIAPVGAQRVFDPCTLKTPMSILHIHGTEDPCARYHGGQCGGCYSKFLGLNRQSDVWDCPDVEQDLAQLAAQNGCSGGPVPFLEKGQVSCRTFGACREDSEVVLCSVKGAGHSWPGGSTGAKFCASRPDGPLCRRFKEQLGPQNFDISASELIWDFFKKHPKN